MRYFKSLEFLEKKNFLAKILETLAIFNYLVIKKYEITNKLIQIYLIILFIIDILVLL